MGSWGCWGVRTSNLYSLIGGLVVLRASRAFAEAGGAGEVNMSGKLELSFGWAWL